MLRLNTEYRFSVSIILTEVHTYVWNTGPLVIH
jgi:hypothetical protein